MKSIKRKHKMKFRIGPFMIRDRQKKYFGYAYLNFVWTDTNRKYLNINGRLRMKDGGKWKNFEDTQTILPLSAFNMLLHCIKKRTGPILYNAKSKRRWKLEVQEGEGEYIEQ